MYMSAPPDASIWRASTEEAANEMAASWPVFAVQDFSISPRASLSDAAAKTVMSAACAPIGATARKITAAARNGIYLRGGLIWQVRELSTVSPAITSQTGGPCGGGASLTNRGRSVLQRYRAIEERATRSVSSELRALSLLASGTGSPRRFK